MQFAKMVEGILVSHDIFPDDVTNEAFAENLVNEMRENKEWRIWLFKQYWPDGKIADNEIRHLRSFASLLDNLDSFHGNYLYKHIMY